ncbi:MAG TPA: IS3 family transposase [Puia sp.]|nr:IS3 family transposase [Puia sp.]
MKQDYPYISKEVLCRLFGKTRHAYYDHQWRCQDQSIKDDIILHLVHKIRNSSLPRLGTRKLLIQLKPDLAAHQIQVGRDYLFDLLEEHKLLIRRRKRKVFTTDSRHWMRKYANLTRDLIITRPEQLWVSDITYIRMGNQWGYLSLITDAYSHKIMGIGFRNDLLALGCLEALQMALDIRSYGQHPLIHHSDRGCQYCSKEYVDLLNAHHIAISMTERGDPYENALAERMNGIIKEEFNLYSSQENFENTYQRILKSVTVYNEIRPHGSCDDLTPCQAHKKEGELKKTWKNYSKYRIQKQIQHYIEEAGQLPPQSKPPPLLFDLSNKKLPLFVDSV